MGSDMYHWIQDQRNSKGIAYDGLVEKLDNEIKLVDKELARIKKGDEDNTDLLLALSSKKATLLLVKSWM